ncbi:hypothetical protein AHAS_Ahas11G0241700 [Arachis hypogaea]
MEPPSMLYSQLKVHDFYQILCFLTMNFLGSRSKSPLPFFFMCCGSMNVLIGYRTGLPISRVGIPLVFKSSFVKANRTSSKSFGGLGMVEVLKILEKVKVAYDLPIVIDVHDSIQCEVVGRIADIIQITAFLCRQTDLLIVAAKTEKIIHVKKGQFCAPSVMANLAEKVQLAGNPNVMVCERGTMFRYNDLIFDPRNLEWMREANCPILDGGGVASGGLRELIPCIVRTAVAIGVDGIFMEVHDDLLSAPIDGPTQWVSCYLSKSFKFIGHHFANIYFFFDASEY